MDKIENAALGKYTIKEKEACAIGGRLGYEMQYAREEEINMAYIIFTQIPFTFIRKLISKREELEFEEAWQSGFGIINNEDALSKITLHHNKILILKALLRNLEWERDKRKIKRYIKILIDSDM